MSAINNRTVYFDPKSGKWANKLDYSGQPTSLHDTQEEAEEAAREFLKSDGGGELTTHDRKGVIRSKDTIGKPDPNPPRDTEH